MKRLLKRSTVAVAAVVMVASITMMVESPPADSQPVEGFPRTGWGEGPSVGGGREDRQRPPFPPDAERWASLGAGWTHACGIQVTGSLWCWGRNDPAGVLGVDGTEDFYAVPMQVGSSTDWAQVDGGFENSCATRTDGSLWCWGLNGPGLGLGTPPGLVVASPTRVGTGDDWQSVNVGDGHTCAVRTTGTLWCWGWNTESQLGLGPAGPRTADRPTQVGTESDWAAVAVDASYSCAIKTTGTLWCWGQLDYIFSAVPAVTTPTQVGPAQWTAVDIGHGHACGVQIDATMWCWGDNDFYPAVGQPTEDFFPEPTQVGNDTDWLTVTSGVNHNCGIRAPDQAYCWGDNRALGLAGLPGGGSAEPQHVEGSWQTMAAGHTFTVALGTPVAVGPLVCNGLTPTIDMNTNGGDGLGTNGPDVILGTRGPDIIDGQGGDDVICGFESNDVIAGGDGNDTIFGQLGDDTITGGPGDDFLTGQFGDDVIDGGPGDDTIHGHGDDDELRGGEGNDLVGGGIGHDVIDGGPGDDRLTGSQGEDEIDGGDGHDTIHGNDGRDDLRGGEGDDRIFGYASSDRIEGGAGNDRLHGHSGRDDIDGGPGDDFLFGYAEQDFLDGGSGDDVLRGNRGPDDLHGGDDADVLWGSAGEDRLFGDAGDDLLFGNWAADELHGGPGIDECSGGQGADTAATCETVDTVP